MIRMSVFVRNMVVLAGCSLALLAAWNSWDPLPPTWDEAQHLLVGQQLGEHVRHYRGSEQWWHDFWVLSQRYPPLLYWLTLPFSVGTVLDRTSGQLVNFGLIVVLAMATQRLGTRGWNPTVGWLGAALICLYPATGALAHLYQTDFLLMTTVAIGYWAALCYWQDPNWKTSGAVGVSLGLILLAKWNGLFFLAAPLLAFVGRALWLRQWRFIGHGLVMTGSALGVCGSWYGANLLFVITNGLNYAATTHYYVTCAAGSLCWWTTYLRWLPLQMSPVLCWLPLLVLWPKLDSSQPPTQPQYQLSGLGATGGLCLITAGLSYLIYTLIGIKDPRFTTPLLPLLAVLSGAGITHSFTLFSWPRLWMRSLLLIGWCSLLWLGQPMSVRPALPWLQHQITGYRPQEALIQWLHLQAQPQDLIRDRVGLLPNTALLSPETLTYLARVEALPLSFLPVGKSRWPDLEIALLDRHVDRLAGWGSYGDVYKTQKEKILAQLQQSPDWQAHPPIAVDHVGTLQTYVRSAEYPLRIEQDDSLDGSSSVHLVSVHPATACQSRSCSAWDLVWTGSAAQLARTAIWLDVLDTRDESVEQQEFTLAWGQLRQDQPPGLTSGLKVSQTVFLKAQRFQPNQTYQLVLRWQTGNQPPQSYEQSDLTVDLNLNSANLATQISPDPQRQLLAQAAQAAQEGNLDRLSRYLSTWTTLRFHPGVTDPDLDLLYQLLAYRLEQAATVEQQIQLHYQLGLIAVTQLHNQRAQFHFQQLGELEPDNSWNRAYLSLVRLGFSKDFRYLKTDVRALLHTLQKEGTICSDETTVEGLPNDMCQLLSSWDLIRS